MRNIHELFDIPKHKDLERLFDNYIRDHTIVVGGTTISPPSGLINAAKDYIYLYLRKMDRKQWINILCKQESGSRMMAGPDERVAKYLIQIRDYARETMEK